MHIRVYICIYVFMFEFISILDLYTCHAHKHSHAHWHVVCSRLVCMCMCVLNVRIYLGTYFWCCCVCMVGIGLFPTWFFSFPHALRWTMTTWCLIKHKIKKSPLAWVVVTSFWMWPLASSRVFWGHVLMYLELSFWAIEESSHLRKVFSTTFLSSSEFVHSKASHNCEGALSANLSVAVNMFQWLCVRDHDLCGNAPHAGLLSPPFPAIDPHVIFRALASLFLQHFNDLLLSVFPVFHESRVWSCASGWLFVAHVDREILLNNNLLKNISAGTFKDLPALE